MTIEEIRKGAPSGARFYDFWDIGLVYLDKIYLDKWEWFDRGVDSWVEVDFVIDISKIKPLF